MLFIGTTVLDREFPKMLGEFAGLHRPVFDTRPVDKSHLHETGSKPNVYNAIVVQVTKKALTFLEKHDCDSQSLADSSTSTSK